MTTAPIRLLLLEDNPGDARLVQTALSEHAPGEFALVRVERLADAIAHLDVKRFELVLCDLGLPDSTGLATAKALTAAAPALPLVVLTGSHDQDLGRAAIRDGAQDYLIKDELSGTLLVRTLRYAIERKRLELGLRAAKETLEQRVAARTAELELANHSLRRSEARFRILTEMSSDFYWETDERHRLTQRGSAGKSSTVVAFQSEAQIGRTRWEIPYLGPDEEAWQAHRETLAAHLPFRDFELSRLGVDGSERFILVSGDPIFDASGAFEGYRGVGKDITLDRNYQRELRRVNEALEQRVGERTQALEEVNRELESFSYSVSHDLRAPLRAVNGFCRLLQQEQCSTGADNPCRDYLARMRSGTEHMAQLIEDLLQLSRLSRQPLRKTPLDLSALVRQVSLELEAADGGRRVEWVIAPEARAEGDAGLLNVVLQNLIGNAWKYSSKRELARIEFGVSSRQGCPVYFVRDNGAGFDIAYAAKLFAPFHRMHSAAEFPGTGIGLATVERIVRRHGGEIWAEGKVDAGATFFFTLAGQAGAKGADASQGGGSAPGSSSP